MKKIIIGVVLVGVAIVLYLGISPIFDVQEVNDAAPDALVNNGSAAKFEQMSDMSSGVENLSEADQLLMKQQMDEMNAEELEVMNDKMVASTEVNNAPIASPVMGTVGHPASGAVRVIDTADGQVVRYENFETINGPRLHVYLSKGMGDDDFIDLGPIRGTTGNINYAVPDGVDLSEYKYILHWCVPFGVLFNYAKLPVD